MFEFVVGEDSSVRSMHGMFFVRIIEDSINGRGNRLTTFQLKYPRCIHGELLTHRFLSRNSMSSRAVPVHKFVEQVLETPYIPLSWGMNQPGMQASVEATPEVAAKAEQIWLAASRSAVFHARALTELGIHKQNANRLLEPFQWMQTVITATEWKNFYALRNHHMAEPHFQLLAKMMLASHNASRPLDRSKFELNDPNAWHLPYVIDVERNASNGTEYIAMLLHMSTARCARVSYLNHDSSRPTYEADKALYARLTSDYPPHASPLEHQAFPCSELTHPMGNFVGWNQHRHNMSWSMIA